MAWLLEMYSERSKRKVSVIGRAPTCGRMGRCADGWQAWQGQAYMCHAGSKYRRTLLCARRNASLCGRQQARWRGTGRDEPMASSSCPGRTFTTPTGTLLSLNTLTAASICLAVLLSRCVGSGCRERVWGGWGGPVRSLTSNASAAAALLAPAQLLASELLHPEPPTHRRRLLTCI